MAERSLVGKLSRLCILALHTQLAMLLTNLLQLGVDILIRHLFVTDAELPPTMCRYYVEGVVVVV